MVTLKITINCGEKTCASAPNKFCQYCGTTNFGTTYVCMLFPNKDQPYTELKGDEWLLRCPECLQASNEG